MAAEHSAHDRGESAPADRTSGRTGVPAQVSPFKMRVRELSRDAEALVEVWEEARRRSNVFLDRLKNLFGG